MNIFELCDPRIPKDYKFPHISLCTVPRVGLLDPAEGSGLIVIVIIYRNKEMPKESVGVSVSDIELKATSDVLSTSTVFVSSMTDNMKMTDGHIWRFPKMWYEP